MTITNSILATVKAGLGIQASNTSFDLQLVTHVNSVFAILQQMGIGDQVTLFSIEDDTAVWGDFLVGSHQYLSSVKSYMILKTKQMFDPSTSGIVSTAQKELVAELESRLATDAEYIETTL